MEALPVVRYATTSDGYSIAYTVHGMGPPLVCLPFPFSHAQRVWRGSSATPLLQALAKRFRVVYYDSRGQGISQRGLSPNTAIDSFMLDLRAVMDALHLEQPVILGVAYHSHVAVRFALENPHRVAGLALMHCAISFADGIAGNVSLAKANWDYFLSTQAGLAAPSTVEELQRLAARLKGLKDRTTQEDMLRSFAAFEASNIGALLPRLEVPTLVIHASHQQWVNEQAAARTAALIRGGRLAVLNSSEFFGDEEAAIAIEDFYHDQQVVATVPDSPAGDVGAHQLSVREVEVLRLVTEGKTNQEIAQALVISLNTVTRHVSHIYAKASVANRAQAAIYARDHGLA